MVVFARVQVPTVKPVPDRETWCLYVQRQFNTVIVLVARAGLQKDHTLLTNTVSMWHVHVCMYVHVYIPV